MKIFIAEKPDMGKKIAAILGNPSPKSGYIACGDNAIVTWCIGHIMTAVQPEQLNPDLKAWQLSTLPIIQEQSLKLAPATDKKFQFSVISRLLQDNPSATVVHACDADREGQLIGDEVLSFCGWRGNTQRLWLNALTPEAIQKALANLQNNADFSNLYAASVARQVTDWVWGINLTRFFTIKARETRRDIKVLSVGRVQTPTLALIVNREKERKNFVPVEHFQLVGQFTVGGHQLEAVWQPDSNSDGLDSEGHFISKMLIMKTATRVGGKSAQVVDRQDEEKQKKQPLPFDLPALQKAASAKLGFSAAKTLSMAQSLYEKQLTTYPRTECRYLPDEMHQDAPKIFAALAKIPGITRVENPDFTIKSAAWNSAKVVAHNGIIPTGSLPESPLKDDETALLNLIALSYFAQFFPPYRYLHSLIKIAADADTLWLAKGNKVLETGWRKVFSVEDSSEKEEPEIDLPPVKKGDSGECSQIKLKELVTTPPPVFDEGKIIDAMEQVHKFVTDPAMKKMLKETSGIGTPATRASIIERLVFCGYITRSKKQLISTELGQELIRLVPDKASDPGFTALLEDKLKEIEAGKLRKNDVLHDFCLFMREFMEDLKKQTLTFSEGTQYPCPICKAPLKRLKKKDGKEIYWACFLTENHPTGKPVFLDDSRGKPQIRLFEKKQAAAAAAPSPSDCPDCPECGKKMKSIVTKKGKGERLFACFEEHSDGKPRFVDPKKVGQ